MIGNRRWAVTLHSTAPAKHRIAMIAVIALHLRAVYLRSQQGSLSLLHSCVEAKTSVDLPHPFHSVVQTLLSQHLQCVLHMGSNDLLLCWAHQQDVVVYLQTAPLCQRYIQWHLHHMNAHHCAHVASRYKCHIKNHPRIPELRTDFGMPPPHCTPRPASHTPAGLHWQQHCHLHLPASLVPINIIKVMRYATHFSSFLTPA